MRKYIKRGFHKIKEKTKHVTYKTKYVIVKVRERTRSAKDKFNKKDVAQMLTSLFVIIQVYAFKTVLFDIDKTIIIFGLSLVTSAIILWISAGRKEMVKHLLAGIIIVIVLSGISGYILGIKLEGMIIAASAALPVAAMVDLLKK